MSGRLSFDAAAVTARLRQASELADLRPEHRLDAKIDLRPEAVTARLKRVRKNRGSFDCDQDEKHIINN